jgi:hypothetical protein
MVGAGVSILRALAIVRDQIDNPKLRRTVGEIATKVSGGAVRRARGVPPRDPAHHGAPRARR